MEEGRSEMKSGKAPGLDQCNVEFKRRGTLLCDSYDCFIVVSRQGVFQGTAVRHALSRCIRKKETGKLYERVLLDRI